MRRLSTSTSSVSSTTWIFPNPAMGATVLPAGSESLPEERKPYPPSLCDSSAAPSPAAGWAVDSAGADAGGGKRSTGEARSSLGSFRSRRGRRALVGAAALGGAGDRQATVRRTHRRRPGDEVPLGSRKRRRRATSAPPEWELSRVERIRPLFRRERGGPSFQRTLSLERSILCPIAARRARRRDSSKRST